MICRKFYNLSILSCIMSFGFVYLQLRLKSRASVQIYVLRKWVRIVISLSNVALVDYLGVRSLTKEEQLYLRLRRLGKYFSTREEFCTFG
jgi:hypothetical protein